LKTTYKFEAQSHDMKNLARNYIHNTLLSYEIINS